MAERIDPPGFSGPYVCEISEYKPSIFNDIDMVIAMIYDNKTAQHLISRRSAVQQKLWNLFQLGILERHLSIH